MTKIVRVDVDTQYGFCDEQNGGLPVKGGFEASNAAGRLNRECAEKGYVLIGSVDTHVPLDKEFKPQGGIWPPHCVKGTRDWLKMPWTLPENFHFVAMNGSIPVEALDGSVPLYFEKSAYSLLDNWIAEGFIGGLMNKNPTIVFEVYGVALDYCVAAAALGIKKLLPTASVRVLLNACASVSKDTEEVAMREMTAAGIELVR